MLNREQAQAELKKLEIKDWADVRAATTDRLPETMRGPARTLLGKEDKKEMRGAASRKNSAQKLVEVFERMDGPSRIQFFEGLFPGLAPAVERGWQLFERLPYQSGWERKPFRAPGHAAALITRRTQWVGTLIDIVGPYQRGVTWFAAWAAHLSQYFAADALGILFAAVIDAGGREGDEVFKILCESAQGDHEIGGMGRHVSRALLSAARPEGWEFVEKLLLAAQREEGLRQVILETVDEAHPEAFRRMLRLILANNLARFSSTVRAFDVWLGYQWDAVSAGVVNAAIEKMLAYFEDSAARTTAVNGKDAEQAYLALWTMAFEDAVSTVAPAAALLKHAKPEHRFVAAHLLHQLLLIASHKELLRVFDDDDLRVTTRALTMFQHGADERIKDTDLFERLERLIPRYPDKPEKLKPIVWPWTASTVSKQMVADALPGNLAKRPPTRLIAHLDRMGPYGRVRTVTMLTKQQEWDSATRDTLFALLGDPSKQVRETALGGLVKCKLTASEAIGTERLLDRKSGDLRRGVLTLLQNQPDAAAIASAERLIKANSQPQRLAGLELLRELVEHKRRAEEARARAVEYQSVRPELNDAESRQLDAILATGTELPVLENALGLIHHADRTWPAAPVSRNIQFRSPTALRITSALEELLEKNAQQEVFYKKDTGEDWKGLLAELTYGFPHADPQRPAGEDRQRLPLADLWESWWQTRGLDLRDEDGKELMRAVAWCSFFVEPYGDPDQIVKAFPEAAKTIIGDAPPGEKSERWRLSNLLDWMIRLHPEAIDIDFILDAAESALALVPAEWLQLKEAEAEKVSKSDDTLDDLFNYDPEGVLQKLSGLRAKAGWRSDTSPFKIWLKVARKALNYAPQLWAPAQHARHWRLLRWMDEPVRCREVGGSDAALTRKRCLSRDRAGLLDLCRAIEAGVATEADLIEQLLGPSERRTYWRSQFSDLNGVTRRKLEPAFAPFKFLLPAAEKCRRRVLEVEMTRGDNPTAASNAALSLGLVWGIDNLVAILRALGKGEFVRGWLRDNQSRETVFSHLTRCSFPRDGETSADFKSKAAAAKIPEDRLVELAVYAPQWAAHVEHALGWNGLVDAVWWIHAHTKGTDWSVDQEIRELW